MDRLLEIQPGSSRPPCTRLFLTCITILLSSGLAGGLQLTSTGPQTLQHTQGESAVLGCTYTAGPLDTGALDIEWSLISPDSTKKDQMLLSYSGGKKYLYGDPALTQGLDLAVVDPSTGDASLSIPVLSIAHTATYQCKVKKSPGVDMRKLSLVVLAKPSVPRCRVEGGEMVGEAVSLHCQALEGSPPLKYLWSRERGGPLPGPLTQNSVTGELSIRNHSLSFTGIYLCKVSNAVGVEHCRVNLRAKKPPSRTGVIAGTVVGSLIFIIILLVLAVVLVFKLGDRRRFEKEISNDIREDAAAPERRPGSRGTSRSSQNRGQSYSHVGPPQTRPAGGGRASMPSACDRSTGEPKPLTDRSEYGCVV